MLLEILKLNPIKSCQNAAALGLEVLGNLLCVAFSFYRIGVGWTGRLFYSQYIIFPKVIKILVSQWTEGFSQAVLSFYYSRREFLSMVEGQLSGFPTAKRINFDFPFKTNHLSFLDVLQAPSNSSIWWDTIRGGWECCWLHCTTGSYICERYSAVGSRSGLVDDRMVHDHRSWLCTALNWPRFPLLHTLQSHVIRERSPDTREGLPALEISGWGL